MIVHQPEPVIQREPEVKILCPAYFIALEEKRETINIVVRIFNFEHGLPVSVQGGRSSSTSLLVLA